MTGLPWVIIVALRHRELKDGLLVSGEAPLHGPLPSCPCSARIAGGYPVVFAEKLAPYATGFGFHLG